MDCLWALRDVSFDVREGEVIGACGTKRRWKNDPFEKSYHRITRPTSGLAETDGRVGSLLEVGTGFHPELTGRENVSVSGAPLGMKKEWKSSKKLDAIVDFAAVERDSLILR